MKHISVSLWPLLFFLFAMNAWATETKVTSTAPVTSAARVRLDGGFQNAPQCNLWRAALQEELKTLQYPPGWTITVTCLRSYWDTARRNADSPRTNTAFSKLRGRTTVLNGEIFQQSRPFYRGIIAHELGHIKCDCADEATAERIAWELQHPLESKDSSEAATTGK